MIIRRIFSDGSSKSTNTDRRTLHFLPSKNSGEITTTALNATILEDVFTYTTDANNPNSAIAIARIKQTEHESFQIIDESGEFKANRMTLYQIDETDRKAYFPYDGSEYLAVLRYEPLPEQAFMSGIEELFQDPNAAQTM